MDLKLSALLVIVQHVGVSISASVNYDSISMLSSERKVVDMNNS